MSDVLKVPAARGNYGNRLDLHAKALREKLGVALRAARGAEPGHRVDVNPLLVQPQPFERADRDEQRESGVESAAEPDHDVAALYRAEPLHEPRDLHRVDLRRLARERLDATLLRRLPEEGAVRRERAEFFYVRLHAFASAACFLQGQLAQPPESDTSSPVQQ